jgi:hypothetical protein
MGCIEIKERDAEKDINQYNLMHGLRFMERVASGSPKYLFCFNIIYYPSSNIFTQKTL